MTKTIKLNENDNVATALRKLNVGEPAQNLKCIDEIPKGHKIALTNILKGEQIIKYDQLIGIARKVDSNLSFFKEKFITPVDDAIITGVYGSQRILNGIPKWPHYGLDFAKKKGEPVKAMNNGIVTLSESDLYYTGGTIIFDHGHGISTLYMHLEKIFVKVGDHVKKGDVVGTVGATGRATGPHLDIRLNWYDVRLDPASIIKIK